VLIIVCGGFGGKVVKYSVHVSYLHMDSNLEGTFSSASINVSFLLVTSCTCYANLPSGRSRLSFRVRMLFRFFMPFILNSRSSVLDCLRCLSSSDLR
jgi:hypothetical protein